MRHLALNKLLVVIVLVLWAASISPVLANNNKQQGKLRRPQQRRRRLETYANATFANTTTNTTAAVAAAAPTDATTEDNALSKEQQQQQQQQQKSRGMMLCTGGAMINDALYAIYQTRTLFNSSLPIAIMHCNELPADVIAGFEALEGVTVQNICAAGALASQKRLRSWFCKTASLVQSPYIEAMVVDLDVVWFKKPDLLFDSNAYKQTGSLFFRDRVTFQKKKERVDERTFQDVMEEFIVSESKGAVNVTAELARIKISQQENNFFWRNVADREYPALDNFQDSSVVVLDRSRHQGMLQVLSRLVSYFNVGYGDKEIYWLAAIIAGEPFSFEPFFSSLYGDCGLIMHYDPNDVNDPDNAKPMYLNAEWLVEKIHIIGHDLEWDHPKPRLVNEQSPLKDLRQTRGCSCAEFGCNHVADEMQIVLAHTHTRMHTHICTHAHAYTHTYIYMYIPLTHTHTHTLNTHTHSRTHTYAYIYTHIYTCFLTKTTQCSC